MSEPFWQRSFDSVTYAEVTAFIDEGNAEGVNVEYKAASYKNNGMPDFTDKVLSSLVSFANTSGGMLLYGVDEDEITKQPVIAKGIEASTPKAKALRDPAIPLMNSCAQRINPRISLETKTIVIEDGPAQGNNLLLIRVRQGAQPPYSLNNRLIYIRSGEGDELATVTEIEALFRRRVDVGVALDDPWQYINMNVFGYAANPMNDRPPDLMLGLMPAFPATSSRATAATDSAFQDICAELFGSGSSIHRLPHGVSYAPFMHKDHRDDSNYACAFEDGSIGVRKTIMHTRERALDIVSLWRIMRKAFTQAARWPRTVMGYSGPLICQVAMGNIADLTVDVLRVSQWTSDVEPGFQNGLPTWYYNVEWHTGVAVDEIVEDALATLTRQLQYPFFHMVKDAVRESAK